jgi:hypothetical protein
MASCNRSAQAKVFAEKSVAEDKVYSVDEEAELIGDSMCKPVFALGLLPGAKSDRTDSIEPELEPDEDLDQDFDRFQSIPSQCQETSEYSVNEWEPIVPTNIKRQETDENWPSWNGKDLPSESEQCLDVSSSSEQAHDLWCENQWMLPHMSAFDFNMESMAALIQSNGPIYDSNGTMYAYVEPVYPIQLENYVEPVRQTQQEQHVDAFSRRRRESLIDIAKQQQEKEEASKHVDASVKFCPWCGGKFEPSQKFCVFCGNSFNARTK